MYQSPTNFIADMRGPEFLLFFIGFIVFTTFICWLAKRVLDPTLQEMPPPVPVQPDSYEIAYLRGGTAEVSRLAVFNLIQRNYLVQTTENNRFIIKKTADPPDTRFLTPLENYVFSQFTMPMLPREIFLKNQLPSRIENYCQPYANKLERERLLCTEDMKQRANMIMMAGMSALLALGGYKTFIALSKGRTNIGFLIFLIIIGLIVIYKISKPSRISGKGQSYLDQLQLAYDKFKTKAKTSATVDTTSASLDPALMMTMVGVFGVGVLANSAFHEYDRMFTRSGITQDGGVSWQSGGTSNSSCSSSSCGSSCSSSSCSSGSSCGGGGCGGGGCGGCGS